MPHVPDLRSHASHDPGLIAAYAAGDTTGEDLARATELVDACPACADLAADLRAIAAALPATALPRRRRDFRLDPATAARHRRAGWRRLLAPLGGPRFAFAAPLGTGLAALGLAGLLLGSVPGILPGGGTAGTPARMEAYSQESARTPGDDRGAAPVPSAAASAGTDAAGGAGGSDANASGGGKDQPGGSGYGAASPKIPDVAPPASPVPNDGGAALRVQGGGDLLVVLGGTGILTGLGLLALRWSARHFV